MKKGFTLIELLAVIVILAIILLITMPVVLNVINEARKGAFEASARGLVKAAENEYMKNALSGTSEIVTYTFEDSVQTVEPGTYPDLSFSGKGPVDGYIRVYEDGSVELKFTDYVWYVEKEKDSIDIVILVYEGQSLEPTTGFYGFFTEDEGVNRPQLLSSMTPIKWEDNEWIETTANNDNWYNYQNQQWANARSADGSYWVWIPRFAYQIESGYHTNTAGDINIKFLRNYSNVAADETTVDNEPIYSGNGQENFIVHPAFNRNGQNLPGFWVAKFPASNAEHENYDQNEKNVAGLAYTHLVEGKEYFWGHSSWMGGYYLGVVEPLEEDYECNFYLNKRTTTSTDTYNRAYVICDVPYKYTHITNSNYANNEPIVEAPGWYYLYGVYQNIRSAGSQSTIVSHTNTTMNFSNVRATADAYWTEYNTTIPTDDLAMNANISIYNNDHEGFVQSIPNVSAWRGMTVKNAFDKIKAMETNPVYGWDSSESFNIHLMKNSQWGAIVYLAYSNYGKNAEVWSNPSNQYITGCAGNSVNATSVAGCPNAYDTANGMQASTTGNVYGIYDMSGGAYEVVMANFDDINLLGGFNDVIDVPDKYINRYTEYSSNFFGDAIYETSSAEVNNNSWYDNQSVFMDSEKPWLWRGGSHDSDNTGIFSFYQQIGGGRISNYSFRPIIVID